MPFSRPTLAQLHRRIRSDIETRLPGADAALRTSFEWILARALAGAAHGMHGHLAWAARQIVPDTAEAEYMERWGRVWGVTRKAAAQAAGELTITGTSSTVCPAGTEWQSGDGVIYTQDADATISGGQATPTVTATTGGVAGNQDVGATLSLVSPVAGIDTTGTVSGDSITNGTDTEADADLLDRILARIRTHPKGGGPGDYVAWAREVSGITRAWEYGQYSGPGTVGVFPILDNQSGSIIPNAAKVQEVQDHIDARAPITAIVSVYAPTAVDLDLTLSVTPDTAAVRAAVEAELADLLLRVAEPGGTVYLSQINEAISLAAGETDHTLTTPSADVTHAANEIPVLGTITWS